MNKMNIQRLVGMCVIAVLVAAVFPMSSDAAEKIILVGSEDIKDTFEGKWLRRFLKINIPIQVHRHRAKAGSF